MSFEQIDFNRWIRDDWEESQIYENFEYTKYLFVVFQYDETETQNKDREPYLKGIMLWNMPEVVIEHELKDLWKTTKSILELALNSSLYVMVYLIICQALNLMVFAIYVLKGEMEMIRLCCQTVKR